ncbi:uncharacterized protein LOC132718631 [Ruditapes philippinarum]|uniref:uncharacterized protein LOC132718631 n=1 Tax=Ruditapes philippinarum TaxID=129788 RepID=UPI00295AC2BF|nr:uncharacterized protein LOC132718631 [Ruditapes philippinarum]
MTMQLFGALILAGMLCSSLCQEDSLFIAESHKKGNEKILIIKDKTTGKKVTEIDVFENEGYQLGKPVDENICLVSRFLVKADDPPHCFKRIPAIDMQDEIPADLTECKNRDIVFVKPTECLKPDMDHESESENGLRQKRASVCATHEITFCALWGLKCMRRGWLNACVELKSHCVRQGIIRVPLLHC